MRPESVINGLAVAALADGLLLIGPNDPGLGSARFSDHGRGGDHHLAGVGIGLCP
ncbi:hypothetical protein [Pseudomonas sp. PA15(2017)]|uniref:hypothetical protein n=1 Tax=Pseudomonas sp. PA15(2017) TaxID=1932111 RepID=UPI00143B6556|nr:hypothetical protein [Pseudomonas sp. PA15(2017)]